MAVFGILMEYVFYGVIGLIAAGVAAGILVVVGRWYLPASVPNRKTFLFRCARAPFLGWVWVLASWIVYSYILGLVFDRDNGMSTVRRAPMPNSYTVGSISYAFGYLLGPGASRVEEGPNSVALITYLQESEPYLLGSRFLSEPRMQVPLIYDKKFFLVNTRSHNILRFDTMDELKLAAAENGVTVEFGEQWCGGLWKVYSRYHPIWFDWFFPIVSLTGLVFLAVSLLLRARHLHGEVLSASY